MDGPSGSGGSALALATGVVLSDDIDITLGGGPLHAELFGARADVADADGVEASFDARRQVAKHELGHALGVAGGLGAAALHLAIAELNRSFERAYHVTQ